MRRSSWRAHAAAGALALGALPVSCTRSDSAAGTAASAGGTPDKTTLTVKGSDTMVILGQRWAETYMQASPGVTIQVTGGGSGTGIAALINASADICESSRPMKDAEKASVQSK